MTGIQHLREIAAKSDTALTIVQIKISESVPIESAFTGKRGWLRFQSELTCAEALEPVKNQGALISGEWIDGTLKTTRISLHAGAPVMRVIEEKTLVEDAEPDDGWTPVLKQAATVIARDFSIGGNTLHYAIYFGFRDEGDAEEGLIRRLTDRFIGVSNGKEQ
jgi:hypothetical protein